MGEEEMVDRTREELVLFCKVPSYQSSTHLFSEVGAGIEGSARVESPVQAGMEVDRMSC